MRLEKEKFIEKDEGYMRRTKIICTIGPASCSEEVMRELLLAGLNVARMNFSHGTHESHAEMIARFRKVRDELKLPAAVMLDTKGPEIRLGLFDEPVEVVSGQTYTFSTVETPGTAEKCFVNYAELPADVKSEAESKLADLKTAVQSGNVDDIKAKQEALSQVFEKMYQAAAAAQQAAGAQPGADAGAANEKPNDDGVVDADFKEV